MPMQYNNGVTMELVSYGVISQAGSTQAMEFGYDNEIILIESQWNLKQYMTLLHKKYVLHINRITVEFKKESYYHRSGAEEAY